MTPDQKERLYSLRESRARVNRLGTPPRGAPSYASTWDQYHGEELAALEAQSIAESKVLAAAHDIDIQKLPIWVKDGVSYVSLPYEQLVKLLSAIDTEHFPEHYPTVEP